MNMLMQSHQSRLNKSVELQRRSTGERFIQVFELADKIEKSYNRVKWHILTFAVDSVTSVIPAIDRCLQGFMEDTMEDTLKVTTFMEEPLRKFYRVVHPKFKRFRSRHKRLTKVIDEIVADWQDLNQLGDNEIVGLKMTSAAYELLESIDVLTHYARLSNSSTDMEESQIFRGNGRVDSQLPSYFIYDSEKRNQCERDYLNYVRLLYFIFHEVTTSTPAVAHCSTNRTSKHFGNDINTVRCNYLEPMLKASYEDLLKIYSNTTYLNTCERCEGKSAEEILLFLRTEWISIGNNVSLCLSFYEDFMEHLEGLTLFRHVADLNGRNMIENVKFLWGNIEYYFSFLKILKEKLASSNEPLVSFIDDAKNDAENLRLRLKLFTEKLYTKVIYPISLNIIENQHVFTKHYMDITQYASLIEQYFPQWTVNITSLMKDIKFWNAPYCHWDRQMVQYNDDNVGKTLMPSSISAFLQLNAEHIIKGQVAFFMESLIEMVHSLLTQLSKAKYTLDNAIKKLEGILMITKEEREIKRRFVK